MMATPGKPLDQATLAFLRRALRSLSIRETARQAGLSRNTVRKYLRAAVAK